MSSVGVVGGGSPVQSPIQQVPQGPAQQWPPHGPPSPPSPPPDGGPLPAPLPTPPSKTPPSTGTPSPDTGDGDEGGSSLKPWLIGASIVGAGALGALGVLAAHDGGRNIRALRATTAAWNSGAMNQGGLQSIRDAHLGARFAGGIGTGSLIAVATPILNRVGATGRLVQVSRGHLDQVELMATATALRRTVGDAVGVHAPMQRHVLAQLESGRPLEPVLDDVRRSAGGARPVFDNRQMTRYADQTSIVERGRAVGGSRVPDGAAQVRAELGQAPFGDGFRLVETGAETRVNRLVAARGADLGGRDLAEGVGTIQGLNVSTLPPALQRQAVAVSGVDAVTYAEQGPAAAFSARWAERIAPPAGPPNPAPQTSAA